MLGIFGIDYLTAFIGTARRASSVRDDRFTALAVYYVGGCYVVV
jgi:hypothetical protein